MKRFIICFIAGWVLFFIFAASTHMGGEAQEEHPCLLFADGRQAAVKLGELTNAYLFNCDGHGQTIEWLSGLGYNITMATTTEMYLRR